VIIEESVLLRPVGGPDVMRAQVKRLVSEADRPDITIQVMPLRSGAYPGLADPFLLLDFPESHDSSVAYTDGVYSSICLEASTDVQRCSVIFECLVEAALSPQESVAAMIAATMQ
jgi:hypothetical protein